MVNHTYIDEKLEIPSENKYVFLSIQPGRWNLIYFQPVGDANNHGVFMTDNDSLARRIQAMVNSSALGFFKMIKGKIVPKETMKAKPLDYKKMKWMVLRNYAKEMKMPNYYKSKKAEILEWLDKNVG